MAEMHGHHRVFISGVHFKVCLEFFMVIFQWQKFVFFVFFFSFLSFLRKRVLHDISGFWWRKCTHTDTEVFQQISYKATL